MKTKDASKQSPEFREFFSEGDVCPVCESGTLRLVNRDLKFDYKHDTVVLNRDVWECSECQESFLQAKDRREVEKTLTDRRRTVKKNIDILQKKREE